MTSRLSLRTALALTLTVLTLLSAPASADRKRDRWRDALPNEYAPGATAQSRISMEEAIARVQQRTGGRVLDARDQGDAYRLKVLRDGEVRIIFVDARTGRIR